MEITHLPSRDHPVVHHVKPSDAVAWLKQGYRDLQHAPADAMLYGVAFVVMGFLLTFYFDRAPEYVITLSTMFLLLGPFLAIGLYDIARQLEMGGRRINLVQSLTSWRGNIQSFSLYVVLLTVLVFAWFRVSLLMFALFFEGPLPTIDSLVANALHPENFAFLVAYFGTGFFFALFTFAISMVSIPMMLDKDVDAITAMITSFQAVYKNLLTMVTWAAIIVLLTAVGFFTYFIGLIFIMPVIGLATWHAYRALITYER